MNPLSPLTPAGALADQGARRKSTVFVIAFAAVLHVVVLSGLLFLGCSKEDGNAGKQNPAQPSSANPSTAGEPASAAPAPVADNTGGAVAPVEAGNGTGSGAATTATPGAGQTSIATPAAPAASEPVPAPGAPTEYKVVKGDIAMNIAKKNGVTLAALREANKGADLNKLKIGQPLQIPAPTPKAAPAEKATATAATTGGSDGSTHVVKSGETLLRIAKKYGTTVKAIRTANSLTSDNIKVGKKLIIPTPSSATATPAKTAAGSGTLPAAEPAAIPLPAGNATEASGVNAGLPK